MLNRLSLIIRSEKTEKDLQSSWRILSSSFIISFYSPSLLFFLSCLSDSTAAADACPFSTRSTIIFLVLHAKFLPSSIPLSRVSLVFTCRSSSKAFSFFSEPANDFDWLWSSQASRRLFKRFHAFGKNSSTLFKFLELSIKEDNSAIDRLAKKINLR